MKQPRDHRHHLEDTALTARKAREFVEGLDHEGFLQDDRTVYAVVRALEILGEAAKRIPRRSATVFPEVPWRSMSGIRDKLIHDYVNVNLDVVWKTVTEDLPPLLRQIRRVIDETAE